MIHRNHPPMMNVWRMIGRRVGVSLWCGFQLTALWLDRKLTR